MFKLGTLTKISFNIIRILYNYDVVELNVKVFGRSY
jgi:hypothetical protein